jgi:mono/diheme cytochrome c family protein
MVAVLLALSTSACAGVESDAPGEEIYSQLCASCHGASLQGGVGPALGPGSNAADQPDEFIRTTVLRGRGSMPSFSSTLDGDQVDRLTDYLREEQSG